MEEVMDALEAYEKELHASYNFKKIPHQIKKSVEQQIERRNNIIEQIENVIFGVMESAARLTSPLLQIRNQRDWDNTVFTDRIEMKCFDEVKTTTVNFSSYRSRRKFSLIMTLLSEIYKLLQTGTTVTRRELYYQHVGLSEGQGEVDAAMRDVCSLLGSSSWDLGVLPTSKGLVAGRLAIETGDGATLDCRAHGDGLLVPQSVMEIRSMTSDAKYVLIVEKDAVFQKLLTEGVTSQPAPCILITGKGYPDVNTRLLVQRIWETFGLPMFVLTDADPHGIEIMCVYRFGSLGMSTESHFLATPAVRWLGVHPKDITVLGLETSPLTARDRLKIRELMLRPYMQSHAGIRDQVEVLLRLGVKAEIEGMASFATNILTDYYIPTQITARDYF
ncbi:meiotic recombination protein SPO11 isoform X1 [Bacillus rossius redtenbacheri]|uniref:meiotic recombination protein SPO11 isoform X1 n=1 Tax=Bacillus rossius redtenbacheri TaxID=93214 RepID=UPI002FDD2861